MLHRRSVLRGAVSAAALALAAACERGGRVQPAATGTAASAARDDVALVAPDARQSLSVVSATFEQLTGNDQPFAFGLRDISNEPVQRDDIELFVVPPTGEPGGPTAPGSARCGASRSGCT